MNNPKQICLHKTARHTVSDFHFVVKKTGDIEQYRELNEEPINAEGHNKDVIAIGVEGDFIYEEVTPPQLISLTGLILKLCEGCKIDTSMHHIFTHCDYRDPPGDRYCPGKNLHRLVPTIAKTVRERLLGD